MERCFDTNHKTRHLSGPLYIYIQKLENIEVYIYVKRISMYIIHKYINIYISM